jgi:hypothetical protein
VITGMMMMMIIIIIIIIIVHTPGTPPLRYWITTISNCTGMATKLGIKQ